MMVAVVIRLFSPKSSPRKVSPLRYDPSLLPFSCFSSLSFSLWEALHNLKMTCRFTFFPASVGLTWVRFSTAALSRLGLVFPWFALMRTASPPVGLARFHCVKCVQRRKGIRQQLEWLSGRKEVKRY